MNECLRAYSEQLLSFECARVFAREIRVLIKLMPLGAHMSPSA